MTNIYRALKARKSQKPSMRTSRKVRPAGTKMIKRALIASQGRDAWMSYAEWLDHYRFANIPLPVQYFKAIGKYFTQ